MFMHIFLFFFSRHLAGAYFCVVMWKIWNAITLFFKFLRVRTLYFFLLGTPRPSLEWWIQDGHGEKLLLHTDAQSNDKDKTSQSILDYGPLQVGAFCQDLVRSQILIPYVFVQGIALLLVFINFGNFYLDFLVFSVYFVTQ